MNSQKKYDVFISYSRKDLDEVSTFVEMLKTRIPTLEVWMDLEGITAADEFDEKIISAIDASSYVIFAVSPNSNSVGEDSSKWTKKELVYAKNTGKKVIPVLLSGAKLNSWFLFEFGRVDCIDSTSTHQIEKLLKNIAKWSNKELVKLQKEKKVLTIDEQQLLNEARTLKDRIEKNKRVAKIALISVLALSVLIVSIAIGVNRYKAHKGIQWEYTIINDSIIPYTIEISGYECVNGYYSKKISIPQKIKHNDTTYLVTRIGDRAFEGCLSLTSIAIPNSVESVGWMAFYGCSSLTDINIGNSVKNIESGAFYGCSSLTSIKIPNSVTSIGDMAFCACTSLTSIKISKNITTIEELVFSETAFINDSSNWHNGALYINNYLIKVDENLIGDFSVKANTRVIAGGSFKDCKFLESVTIPNSVTSIEETSFKGCRSLKSITIPNSVKSIGDWAFNDCSSLTSITIPSNVTSIGERAFSSCDSLSSIEVADDNPIYDSRDNCNAIIETATNQLLVGCKSTIIPNSITRIGDAAFSDCSSLTSIAIPSSVTSIGDWAFSCCFSLTTITISNGVTNIGEHAFYACGALTAINIENNPIYDSRNNCNAVIETATNTLLIGCKNTIIPNSIISIGNGAFAQCYTLASITIPNSVTSIREGAFNSCTMLEDINYTGTREQWHGVFKRYGWINNAPATVVHCIDGDVLLWQPTNDDYIIF